jgi:hypothetical protein
VPTGGVTVDTDDPSWDGLKPRPIRILVKGASSTVWVAPPGGSRRRQTFPWWLQAILDTAGMPAEVRNAGGEAQMITMALCNWDQEVQKWSPDVVILNYGMYECMPGILPRWTERLATGWHTHPGPVRRRVRRRIIPPVWKLLAEFQRRLDKALNPGPYRVKPKRILAELTRYVDQIKIVGSPLVLVMDPWTTSSRWSEWFPGMDLRAARLRALVHDWLNNRGDPDVRLFPLADLIFARDVDAALPDGVHYSATLHRDIADELAAVILEWAGKQDHLQWPAVDLTRLPKR